MLSRSDSERQRNWMIHDQRPLPVYFSQVVTKSLGYEISCTALRFTNIISTMNIKNN